MKASVKKRWVAALRSGEYKQGMRKLRSADGEFCCLGVLCDIELDDWWVFDEDLKTYSIDGSTTIPSQKVFAKAGLSGYHSRILVAFNDSGNDFLTIARWIEENL